MFASVTRKAFAQHLQVFVQHGTLSDSWLLCWEVRESWSDLYVARENRAGLPWPRQPDDGTGVTEIKETGEQPWPWGEVGGSSKC